ncbi:MAG TPA: ATP-binding protein [Actinomycetota bacterium]|jgi:serine/threonine-protein kinase RsbW|nr:ATP-binding protein [Actinomycetota bacterium]
MQLTFTLCLPRDEASVPFVRHMCRSSLDRLGVGRDCASDIEIAVSEACTNVLRHAETTDDGYEVQVSIDETDCTISVIDTGGDVDVDAIPVGEASPTAESGRGVYLMKALVDDLRFVSDRTSGTVVRLRKSLEVEPGSILARLAGRSAAAPA